MRVKLQEADTDLCYLHLPCIRNNELGGFDYHMFFSFF